MRRTLAQFGAVFLILAAVVAASEPAPTANVGGLEFFEKRIRPLLAENCYQCHGPKKQESGLVLSSAAGLRKGGDRGTPITSGEPDISLLIQAVRYADDDLKMPPRGKLKEDQIADLVAWVRLGAPLPADEAASLAVVRPSNEFDLSERRKHWAYQPVQAPSSPAVSNQAWCKDSIDSFILARLDAAGLSSAPPAEKRTLIRRAAFDLTGLPPTPGEVTAFLADEAPDAYEQHVDRLLASPRYGERFGRHWLDVVRYSESLGFEFDYDLHNAWRYRDYVIRAFNADLPYDRFVIEHLAGDLVPEPRQHSIDRTNESILATGFFWMHEGKQTPVDIRQDQADRIDNQLDVIGKAFLGQTIACARCHDHKFDAISTRDYYALAGYLRSSRYQQAFIDPPEAMKPKIDELTALQTAAQSAARTDAARLWLQEASKIGDYLLAAAKKRDESGLDSTRLQQWSKALADESLTSADHPLFAWSQRAKPDAKSISELNLAVEEQTRAAAQLAKTTTVFKDFRDPVFDGWFMTGDAFSSRSVNTSEIVIGDSPVRPIARLTSSSADSGAISARLQGELRSPSFTIEKKFVHLRLAGRNARVNLVIDGYTLIMNPMYGKLTVAPSTDWLVWRSMPVDRWLGHRAFIEISDNTIPMHGLNPPPSPARMPVGADGYMAIDKIVFSDDANPPAIRSGINASVLDEATNGDLSALAAAYQRRIVEAIERFRSESTATATERDDDISLLNWLLENGLLDAPPATSTESPTSSPLVEFVNRYRSLETSLIPPQRAAAIADGTGEDEFVFLRGNHRTPGEQAPRDIPEVLKTARHKVNSSQGSGRLEFARRLVDPSNPLLPRVLVNRLWQHHFGEGIVRTPDDFGRMGQPPTHPELLDHLAAEFIRNEWSMKAATRQMVTSNTYRMSSAERGTGSEEPQSTPHSALRTPHSLDPDNRLLHHMPSRRLEAEAIRDSMLAVSGRLDTRMHGPSVLPHITPYMEGRGKPQSGPLDGEGRRSIYINARRNFLTPLLLAFDYPVTFTSIGRRGAATIPAQALTLMNDPLVVSEAQRWAEHALATGGSSTEQRIDALYQAAFARPPTADETANAIDFLQHQSLRHGSGSDDPRVWTDLCHVLINVKEFIFVE